jgi:hypothetical protein
MLISRTPAVAVKTGELPELKINGNTPSRKAAGPAWGMISVDLRTSRGKELRLEAGGQEVEGWLIMDRPCYASPPDADPRLPMPYRRASSTKAFVCLKHKAGSLPA